MPNITIPMVPDTSAEEPNYRFRKLMPMPIKKIYRVVRAAWAMTTAYCYDALRFARYSGTFHLAGSASSRVANIVKYYHTIEKGLALPAPRPGFGRQVNKDLCEKLRIEIGVGNTGEDMQFAIDAVAGYAAFNQANGVDNPPWIGETLAFAAANGISPKSQPTKVCVPHQATLINERLDFLLSRHSVRHFAPDPVPDHVLELAARAAQSAPCVCNRQASKVYFVRDPDLKARMLRCQNGNRGFGDTAPVVALVTVDQSAFLEPSERYQPWIDGGLFTMNLLLGLHAQAHGACCLNWSALPSRDKALRRLGIIPPTETVITMVAIGKLRGENYLVARSERRALNEVMRIL